MKETLCVLLLLAAFSAAAATPGPVFYTDAYGVKHELSQNEHETIPKNTTGAIKGARPAKYDAGKIPVPAKANQQESADASDRNDKHLPDWLRAR